MDLGFTTVAKTDTSLKERCGTLMYAAPDIFDPKSGCGYGRPVDVFALGVTLYYMLSGHFPFHVIMQNGFSAYEYWKILRKAALAQTPDRQVIHKASFVGSVYTHPLTLVKASFTQTPDRQMIIYF